MAAAESGDRPGAVHAQMASYDSKAWAELKQWKSRRLGHQAQRLLPGAWRDRVSQAGSSARERFEALTAAGRFETLFLDALRGLTDLGSRAAMASVRREAVVNAYRKRGHSVTSLEDIRLLELRDVDNVKPRLDLAYVAASTVEGAGAGLAVSGGQLALASGTVIGAGAGAAPGAVTVVAAMAADAAAVLLASQRAVAHIAAYYGYDLNRHEERVFALGVLGVGTAAEAGKLAAYIELNRLVQGLARRQAWTQLNERGLATVISKVYTALGMRLTQRKLAQAVPIAGIVIGAGLNARLLAKVVDDADHLYRERFLQERYDLEPDVGSHSVVDQHAVNVADIIDAEIVEEHER